MPCRLVLWDIDHTLIENSGISKEIYAAAFMTLTGRQACQPAQTEGRTDPEIMGDLLQLHGAPSYPWETVRRALEQAGADHREPLSDRGSVLPGVREVIKALAESDGLVQTVVTGNIRANAEVKLDALGLLRSFDLEIGGYGSDDTRRSRLVDVAMMRAAARYGSGYDRANTIVVGDTPRDVQAGHDNDVRVLAVATGTHSADELHAAGATFVVPSLADVATVLEFILAPHEPEAGEAVETP
jgi:phosphoglycolate phosphatase-like HAD superfamily hydrolase